MLHVIRDIDNWRSLGQNLGIVSAKLDEIGRHSIKEQKSRMVGAWLESEKDCTWEKLYNALRKPAVSVRDIVHRASELKVDPLPGVSFQAISPTSTRSMNACS